MMKLDHAVAILLVAFSIGAVANVLQYELHKVQSSLGTSTINRRAGPIDVALGNDPIEYYIKGMIGTPPQSVQFQIDSGSSDTWVSASSAPYCIKYPRECSYGTFDASRSSSYKPLDTVFNITYVDGTGSVGKYFTDNLQLGTSTLTALQMGLATNTTIGNGLMGIGFADSEAICTRTPCQTYPNILDTMLAQNQINSRTYSIWLNDPLAPTGSILFGGVDVAKYNGVLQSVPIQADSTKTFRSFAVDFTSLQLGGTTYFTGHQRVIIDSGTTLLYLPRAVFNPLRDLFGVVYNLNIDDNIYTIPCNNISQWQGKTLDFQFGDNTGPTIHIPILNFFQPLKSSTGAPYTERGKAICEFLITGPPLYSIYYTTFLFGDSFLRNAYVVHDLDNKIISMADTVFNATGSRVAAIPAGLNGLSLALASASLAPLVVSTPPAAMSTTSTRQSSSTSSSARTSTTSTSTTTSSGSTAISSSTTSDAHTVTGIVVDPTVTSTTAATPASSAVIRTTTVPPTTSASPFAAPPATATAPPGNGSARLKGSLCASLFATGFAFLLFVLL